MYTRAFPTDILARRTKVRGLCRRAERAARAAAGRLPRPARADFHARRTRRLPREDSRAEVGEEVRVGVVVGVRVGPVEFKIKYMFWARIQRLKTCMPPSQRSNFTKVKV